MNNLNEIPSYNFKRTLPTDFWCKSVSTKRKNACLIINNLMVSLEKSDYFNFN